MASRSRWCRSPFARQLATSMVAAGLLLQSGSAAGQHLEPGHVRIRASLEPERVMVGQRADLKVEVLTRTWFLGAPAYPDTLEVADAVVMRPNTFGTNFTERIDGLSYAGQSRRFAVFPVAPGRLTIPSVAVTLVVARDDGSRSDPVTLTTEPFELVAAIPEAARGLGLVPATPRLTAAQEWAPTAGEWTVGDAVTRTVDQRIEASVAMVLPAVTEAAPDGVAVYSDRPVIATESERGSLRGARTDTVTYVFEREGRFELPEVVIHWWDVGAGRLRTESLPGLTVEVATDPGLAAEHLRAPEDEVAGEPLETSRRGFSGWRELVVGLVSLAGVWVLRRRLGAGLTRIRRLLERSPTPERVAWRTLGRAIDTEDAPVVLAALYRWLDEVRPDVGGPWREVARRAGPDTVKAIEAVEHAALQGDAVWSRSATRRAAQTLRRQLSGGLRRHVGELPRLNPAPSPSAGWSDD